MILSKIEVHAYKLRTECGVRLNSMVNKVEYLYHRHALFSLHGATSRPRMKRLARSFYLIANLTQIYKSHIYTRSGFSTVFNPLKLSEEITYLTTLHEKKGSIYINYYQNQSLQTRYMLLFLSIYFKIKRYDKF